MRHGVADRSLLGHFQDQCIQPEVPERFQQSLGQAGGNDAVAAQVEFRSQGHANAVGATPRNQDGLERYC